jgi:hypothetical protein
VLEHAQHAELTLLIDEGVVRDDGEVEVQSSGDSYRCDDVVLLDLVHDVHAFRHLAKYRVDLIEMRLRRVGNEKLTSSGVLPGMCHREGSGGVLMGIEVGLTFDLVSRPTGAHPWIPDFLRQRVTPLDHEIRDDPVEPGSIVKFAVRQLFEVADGVRHLSIVQLGFNGALAGLDRCILGHEYFL